METCMQIYGPIGGHCHSNHDSLGAGKLTPREQAEHAAGWPDGTTDKPSRGQESFLSFTVKYRHHRFHFKVSFT